MSNERSDPAELSDLLRRASESYAAMTPAEKGEMHRQQRLSYVSAEMAFGSDADERAMACAIQTEDHETIARLSAEAEDRRQAAIRYMQEHGL